MNEDVKALKDPLENLNTGKITPRRNDSNRYLVENPLNSNSELNSELLRE